MDRCHPHLRSAMTIVGLEIFGPAAPGAVLDPTPAPAGSAWSSSRRSSPRVRRVGCLVVPRQPRNPVGWLLTLVGVSFVRVGMTNQMYLQIVLPVARRDRVVADLLWLGNWIWVPAILPLFTLLPLLFPTGRPLSPRWRVLVWVVAGATVLVAWARHSSRTARRHSRRRSTPRHRPPGGSARRDRRPPCSPVALASIASIVVRFRRSTGVERQQLKWVAFAAACCRRVRRGRFVGDAAWPLMLLALSARRRQRWRSRCCDTGSTTSMS